MYAKGLQHVCESFTGLADSNDSTSEVKPNHLQDFTDCYYYVQQFHLELLRPCMSLVIRFKLGKVMLN